MSLDFVLGLWLGMLLGVVIMCALAIYAVQKHTDADK